MAAATQDITSQNNERAFWSPHFVVRVGGLPIERATELSTSRTAEWMAEVLAVEDELSHRSQSVVDFLFDAVKAVGSDAPRKNTLLSLKRDVYNSRVPKHPETFRAALTKFDAASAKPALDWLDLSVRYGELQQSGEELLRQEVLEKRAALKRTLANDTFRKGLFIASESIEKSLDAYLAAPNTATSRRVRKSERSSLLYLFRTSCKTSPFSTLTPVCSGRFCEEDGESDGYVHYAPSDNGVRTACNLNVMILGRVAHYLYRREELALALPVRLVSPLLVESGRVRYLRRCVTTSESDLRPADTVKIVSYYLPLSDSLRQVLEVLQDGRSMIAAELIEHLSSRSEADDRSELHALVLLLIELGLLINPDLWVSLSSDDPFSPFLEGLRSINHPDIPAICSHLEEAQRLSGTTSAATAFQRRGVLGGIRSQLTAAFEKLGRSESDLTQTLVYEDGALDPVKLELPLSKWRPHLESLLEFQSLLPALETSNAVRLVMKGFFKTVYGKGEQCDDVLSFCEVFRNDYYEQYQQASLMSMFRRPGKQQSINHFNVKELTLLDSARLRLAKHVEAIHEADPNAREIVLDRDIVLDIGAEIPRDTSLPSSHCFAAQAADTKDGLLLVINRIYSGVSHMYSRFMRLLSQGDPTCSLAQRCREQLLAIQPSGAVFAQLPGGVDTNLNLYPELAPYEITFPGGRSVRPPSAQIPVNDLFIRHDASADRLELRSHSLGSRVIPLYLGFMIPAALPQLYQLLLNFSPLSFVPSYQLLAEPEPEEPTIICMPRIRYDGIVLSRASWQVPSEMLPRRADVASDSEYMLSILRWRRKHGIPQRVFMMPAGRPARPAETENEDKEKKEKKEDAGAANAVNAMMQKPLYIDFDSYFSAMLFGRAVSRGVPKVNLTEPLPDQSELCLRTEDGSYVTEFMIEMNRTFTEVS